MILTTPLCSTRSERPVARQMSVDRPAHTGAKAAPGLAARESPASIGVTPTAVLRRVARGDLLGGEAFPITEVDLGEGGDHRRRRLRARVNDRRRLARPLERTRDHAIERDVRKRLPHPLHLPSAEIRESEIGRAVEPGGRAADGLSVPDQPELGRAHAALRQESFAANASRATVGSLVSSGWNVAPTTFPWRTSTGSPPKVSSTSTPGPTRGCAARG